MDPRIGPRQHFPQRCMECGERFAYNARITMLPALEDGRGQVLWYVWLDEPCARLAEWIPWLLHPAQRRLRARLATFARTIVQPRTQPSPPLEEVEPDDARRARLAAERQLNRRAIATGRARKQYGG